jgi:hypothetical protein
MPTNPRCYYGSWSSKSPEPIGIAAHRKSASPQFLQERIRQLK